MSEQVVNIGQVAAIWIASTPPENIKLIWYDTASQVHRVYDSYTGDWVPLNPQIITPTSINTLRSEAVQSGLPIGKFYNLEDTGTLAISITTTKIWYVDTHGNYVVDDLASSAQYYLNSTNLYIDGETGVWDVNSGHLSFSFNEENTASNLDTDKDYVVMRHNVGNGVWSWIKSKISTFIPSGGGNSIIWNNGIYFNFSSAIDAIKNVAGGIVGKDEYETDKAALQQSIRNTALDNQSYADAANAYTDTKVTDEKIYDKELPTALTVPSAPPTTPSVGAKLIAILGQIYGWIAKLKHGNAVMLDQGLNPDGIDGNINATDSVVSAFNKVIGWIKKLQLANNINVGTGFNPDGVEGDIVSADSVQDSIEKLIWKTKNTIRINEDSWHFGSTNHITWIIRNDVLFFKIQGMIAPSFTHASNYADRPFVIDYLNFGDDIALYIDEIFANIDWMYNASGLKQKWIYLRSISCYNFFAYANAYPAEPVRVTCTPINNDFVKLYFVVEEKTNTSTGELIHKKCFLGVMIEGLNLFYNSAGINETPVYHYYQFSQLSDIQYDANIYENQLFAIPLSF